ncbi:MAG TPA: thioesterase family protein [Rubricoccaceae bacterium]|jgi:acyl-CoA thioester hydrolase
MTHTSRVPLRWSDLDALGHVNNAVYLTLCEQGRTEALAALIPAGWIGDTSPVLVAASLTFRRPILTTGTALVATTFETPGRSSLRTRFTITLDTPDAVVNAEGEATLVWIDVATGRPVPVPDVLRAAIAAGTETDATGTQEAAG